MAAMLRVLVVVDVAAGGGFGPAQWLALLGAALLAVCVVVFLCGSSSAKRGDGKVPAQEMAARSAVAASTTRTGCEEAPTPKIASRSTATASTATNSGGDRERSHRRCCVCAGWPECGPCGGPCYSGFGAEGGDFCSSSCCCDCGGCDCSGADCGGCVDCIGGCCGACMMLLASC